MSWKLSQAADQWQMLISAFLVVSTDPLSSWVGKGKMGQRGRESKGQWMGILHFGEWKDQRLAHHHERRPAFDLLPQEPSGLEPAWQQELNTGSAEIQQ